MAHRGVGVRLDDISQAIAGIRETLKEHSFETFCESWAVQRAVERGLEIISEASRRIPGELKSLAPEIPWRRVADLGNVLRHDYQRVEAPLVWNIAAEYLDPLATAIDRMSKHLGEDRA